MQRKKRKIVILGVVFFILAILFLSIRLNIFIIKSASLQPPTLSCADSSQIKNSTNLIGQNIFLVNFQKTERDVKNKFLCVKNISIARNLPDKINLSFQEREAVAILAESTSSTSSAILKEFIESSSSAQFKFPNESSNKLLVDSEGMIYSQNTTDFPVPLLYVYGLDLKLGQKLDGSLMNSLIILDKVKIYRLSITEASIFEDVLMINTAPKIIFKLRNDIDKQIASLQLILEKAKMETSKLEFIDLRFDKPIVRIAPKKNG